MYCENLRPPFSLRDSGNFCHMFFLHGMAKYAGLHYLTVLNPNLEPKSLDEQVFYSLRTSFSRQDAQ